MTEGVQTLITQAPWLRRLAALLYDLLIVLALQLVVGLLVQLALQARLVAVQGGHAHVPVPYQGLQFMVVCGYFVLSWWRGGQTIGARAWRLRVVDSYGMTLRFPRAVLRAAVAALPLLALLLGFVASVQTALMAVLALWVIDYASASVVTGRRTLHDRISGTRLVSLSRG